MLLETVHLTSKAAVMSLWRPAFWLVILGATVVCFLSGPFGTLEALPVGLRFIYWALIVVTSGLISIWVHAWIRTLQWYTLSKIALVSVIFGLIVVGLVVLFSLPLLHPIQRYPGHLEILAYSFPSAAITFFISVVLSRPRNMTSETEAIMTKRPDLFGRLEKHANARRILSLCAQDHYVEVTTEKGSELCLMRLKDAITEAEPEEGLQIHRSHWVAKSAVEKLETKGSSWQVRLTDGRVLIVSQSRLKELKAFLQ